VTSGWGALDARQRALVEAWLPGAEVEADLGWGLVATTVLRVRAAGGGLCVVKAGGPSDHHIAREIRAHLSWLGPWVRSGRAPTLLHHDADARVLVTRWLPGRLVLDDPAAGDPEVYAQAGRLLAQLHAVEARPDDGYEARENARMRRWLASAHRIAPADATRLSAMVDGWPEPPATLVPTHGDWQPRNWLVHEGEVRAIDLGRADLRPAGTDLARLAARDFRRDPALEAAFLDGYGGDPRDPRAGARTRVREAVATAAWAHQVGDEAFEREGLALVAEVLAEA
jgi:antitoxin (DNA-binding transcriptional repressor) of toxin-antitoxin stability system